MTAGKSIETTPPGDGSGDWWYFFGQAEWNWWSSGLWSGSWGALPGTNEAPLTSYFVTSLENGNYPYSEPSDATTENTVEVAAPSESVVPTLLSVESKVAASASSAALAGESGGTTPAPAPVTHPAGALGLAAEGPIDFGRFQGDITVDLGQDLVTVQGDARPVTFSGVFAFSHNVVGNDGNGTYTGSALADKVVSGDGSDTFHAFSAGDVLTSGGGDDVFVFRTVDLGGDKALEITDFAIGHDHLDVTAIVAAAGPGHTEADVIRLVDTPAGALVQGLVDGQWKNIAVLDHVAASTTLGDILL